MGSKEYYLVTAKTLSIGFVVGLISCKTALSEVDNDNRPAGCFAAKLCQIGSGHAADLDTVLSIFFRTVIPFMSVVLEKQRMVLRFQGAVLTTDPYARTVSEALNLEVYAGELFLIRLERSDQIVSFADVCNGTILPLSGSIFFLGKDWRNLSADVANALRGRTGHVFFTGNWTRSLPVVENILIPQLYHTPDSSARLLDQAGHLVERFGLPGCPRDCPAISPPSDLQRAACVRAFIGRPLLILLQEPTHGWGQTFFERLIQTIRDARSRGAAVIWLTTDKEVWNDATIPATHRYHLVARNLMEVKLESKIQLAEIPLHQ